MDVSKLKRKPQHELPDFNSKEKKHFCDDKKPRTEFTDMIDDVIDMILSCLELNDLVNVSDTNIRLRNIAASVFSRKYRNNLISINSPEVRVESIRFKNCKMSPLLIRCKKPIVGISDAKIWFKLLRNFGKSIRFLRVISECNNSDRREIEMLSSWSNVSTYILKYCCADRIEILEFSWYLSGTGITLGEPLTNLKQFYLR